MKLWKISQTVNTGYDTYDSAVVAAEDEATARRMSPSSYYQWSDGDSRWHSLNSDGKMDDEPSRCLSWAEEILSVEVTLIGYAVEGTSAGVIVASFNAG